MITPYSCQLHPVPGWEQAPSPPSLQTPVPYWVFLLLALLPAASLRISLHLLKVGISKASQLLIAQPAPASPLKAGTVL